MSDVCRRIERVAAKEHQCVECRTKIEKGERHAYWSGVSEGRGWSVRMCVDCERIMNQGISDANVMDDEWPNFGELKQWLDDLDLKDLLKEFNDNAKQRGRKP